MLLSKSHERKSDRTGAVPPGVPVMMTLPFCSVVPWERNSSRYAQSKIRSRMPSDCRISSLIFVVSRSWLGSWIQLPATRQGPKGANVSKPFENPHWGTGPARVGSLWYLRAEISFPTVYAAM